MSVGLSMSEDARENVDYSSLLAASVERMNAEFITQSRFEAEFIVADSTETADIVLSLQPTISNCDGDSQRGTFAYCAPNYAAVGEANGVTQISVASRYSNEDIQTLIDSALARTVAITWASDGSLRRQTAELTPVDPWLGKNELTVKVSSRSNVDQDITSAVEDALEYWESNDDRYAYYNATFTLDSDAEDPDILIQAVDSVSVCGGGDTTSTIGCASLLTQGQLASDLERVNVVAGYNQATTTQIVKHELGHLYGLEHGDEPADIMKPTVETETLPQTDAVDKENPWEQSTLNVYVDYDTFDAPQATVEQQITYTLDYYNSGADGYTPDGVNFVEVSSEADADITITSYTDSVSDFPCSFDYGSCNTIYGSSPDADEALETFEAQEISIRLSDSDTIGYHVGYNLNTFSAGAPPPFREDADRDGWWR